MSLIAGAFDLSFGATLALTGVIGAKMLNAGVPWPLVVLLSGQKSPKGVSKLKEKVED